MGAEFRYAEPRNMVNVGECAFYHHMDLPGIGEVGNGWDLRKTVNDYLGNFDFRGKRVLDVGTESGFLSFEMEKRGAEVVSFDRANTADWQLVPFSAKDFDVSKMQANMGDLDASRNGYWLAHRLLKSRARVYYGDIYNIPEEIGQFDVVFLGMVLPHLREPFHALAQTARLKSRRCHNHPAGAEGSGPGSIFHPECSNEPGKPSVLRSVVGFQRGMLSRNVTGARLRGRDCDMEGAYVHRAGSRWGRGVHDHGGTARIAPSCPILLLLKYAVSALRRKENPACV